MKWLLIPCLLLAGCAKPQSETGHTVDSLAAEIDKLHAEIAALKQEIKDMKQEAQTNYVALHQPMIDHTMRLEDAEKRLNELERSKR